jgi:membrane protein DedA with SNARE-associated domain
VIRPGRLRLAARWFSRYGQWVVFAARFLPGTRVIVFVSAGLRGMKPTRFLVLDGVAAAFWVPLVLAVGHWAGERIGGLGRTIEIVGDRVFWILAAVVGLHLARRWWLTRERRLVGDPDSEP